MNPLASPFWIFDLDGTLTVPTHDFEELRRELDLPPGRGILEALEALPAELAAARRARLEAWEREHALRATAQPGAAALLEELARRGVRSGILTRNTREHAWLTLASSGLSRHFGPEDVLGRDCAAAKPSPEGVLALLRRWDATPERAVMAGDFLFDLQAGRAAGVATIYLDAEGLFPHRAWADLAIRSWSELALDGDRGAADATEE